MNMLIFICGNTDLVFSGAQDSTRYDISDTFSSGIQEMKKHMAKINYEAVCHKPFPLHKEKVMHPWSRRKKR